MKKANPFAKKGGYEDSAMDMKEDKKGGKKGKFVPFKKGGKKSTRGR